jgi:hypothetical protein
LVRKIASPIGPIYFYPLRAAPFRKPHCINFKKKLAAKRKRAAIAAALRPCFSPMIATPPLCGYIAPSDPATGVADSAFVLIGEFAAATRSVVTRR